MFDGDREERRDRNVRPRDVPRDDRRDNRDPRDRDRSGFRDERERGRDFPRGRDADRDERDRELNRDRGRGAADRDRERDRDRDRERDQRPREEEDERRMRDPERDGRSRDGDRGKQSSRRRRSPTPSDSDSSETEYTRKPRQYGISLTPEQQLEALKLWLKAHPDVARDVEMIQNRNRPKEPANAPPPFFQDGDWMCNTCGEHNWRNRMECRGCGAPAPAEKIAEVQAAKARVAVNAATHKPQAMAKAGDWMCVGCTTVNYANKTQCFRCNMQKPNEWVCALCNNVNVGQRNFCNICTGDPRGY